MNRIAPKDKAKADMSDLAEDVMRPVLAAAGRRLTQALREIDATRIAPLEKALRLIIAKPHGCIYCDFGKLRNTPTATAHDDDCGYALASKLLA